MSLGSNRMTVWLAHALANAVADVVILGMMLPYQLAAIAVSVFVLTAIGAPIIKFLARPISWWQALTVCASGTAIGFGIYFIVVDILAVVGMEVFDEALRHEIVGKLSIIGILASPIFISRRLAKLGHPQSGIGLMVFAGWWVCGLILTGIAFLAIKLFSP